MFRVIEAERTINGKAGHERRVCIGSVAPDAGTPAKIVRAHWGIENRLHWCIDMALNDDQMRARVKNVGANLAIVRRLVLNLFRLDKSRKGSIRPDASSSFPPTHSAKPYSDYLTFDAITLDAHERLSRRCAARVESTRFFEQGR